IQESSGAIDFGLAYDGDGDRLIIVDGSGNIIWPDKLIMLFARNLLEKNPGGTIVYDVKCSSALKPWIEQHGGVPLMWKTGHSLIRNKMNEVDAVLAGELSGHIFWRDWYGFDDAIYSSCRLIRLLQESGKKLSDMLSELPGGQASPEYRIAMQNDGQAQTTMKQVRAICTNHSAKLVDIDGLRFEYPDRWGLIRPSNTSPVMVCRFEGDDSDKLAAIKKEIHDLLHQVDASLDIPF
ncbi:MAG: phosphomannomutase/phosphoglucomutase, partial [Candidatus Porifericomitaceae bacterium WSBS_2022_MAG_OTU9]